MEPITPTNTINLYSNYFQFNIKGLIFKYKIVITPSVSQDQLPILLGILKKIRSHLQDKFNKFKIFNFVLYSIRNIPDDLIFDGITYDNITYKIAFVQIGIFDTNTNITANKELKNLLGRIITNLQNELEYTRIRRRCFNHNEPIKFTNHQLEIWNGYFVALSVFGGLPTLNIDPAYKVIQYTTILHIMKDFRTKYPKDFREKILEELIGVSVMTTYNRMIYKVDDIDFNKTPKSIFLNSEGKEISFIEYYEAKHKKKILDQNQPLLINKNEKTNKEIFLIPELCVATGLTNKMRSDYGLMQDLSRIIKPDPTKRLGIASELIKKLLEEDKTKDFLKNWSMTIEPNPIKILGEKINAGNILIRNKKEIPIESNSELERQALSSMYYECPLLKWGILYPSRNTELCDIFMENLQKATETYQEKLNPPKRFPINNDNRFDNWKKIFEEHFDESMQAVVLLLPGPKKQGYFYDEVKQYFMTKCPIPSQVVLISTIQAGKNIRSICSKIFTQICTKVGSLPWIIDKLPFTDKPTMLIGIDVYKKKGKAFAKHSIFSFCATTDNKFSKYWSIVRENESDIEIKSSSVANISNQLIEVVKKAILIFKDVNHNFAPINILVFRDGISASERQLVQQIEINAFKIAFDELLDKKQLEHRPNLIFICTSKPAGVKFFFGDTLTKPNTPLKNPYPGTIIDKQITQGRDFYLISQRTTQGTATPTHYYILCNYRELNGNYTDESGDNLALDPKILKDIEILCYKLCHLYYNWIGAVKIPAPVKYAQKLSTLIGERWKAAIKPMIPSESFQKLRSLYFI